MYKENDVLQHVGHKNFQLGKTLVANGDVSPHVFHEHQNLAFALVREGRNIYNARLQFKRFGSPYASIVGASCACTRTGAPCPHSTAALLSIIQERRNPDFEPLTDVAFSEMYDNLARGRVTFDSIVAAARKSTDSAWRRALTGISSQIAIDESTVGPGAGAANAPAPTVALQFEVLDAAEHSFSQVRTTNGKSSRPTHRLGVRPARLGETGNWVRTGADWETIGTYRSKLELTPEQLTWFDLLWTLGRDQDYQYYRSAQLKWVMLDDFDNPFLWTLLDQARALGIPLLNSSKNAPPVAILSSPATAEIDARESPEGHALHPHFLLEGARVPTSRACLIGSPAHGLFTWSGSGKSLKTSAVTLARLEPPLPEATKALFCAPEVLQIPSSDIAEFTSEYLPVLQRTVPIVSSDDSLDIVDVARPRLLLTVESVNTEIAMQTGAKPAAKRGAKAASKQAEAHPAAPRDGIRLSWSWEYVTRDGKPVAAADRDAAAETATLDSLTIPWGRYPVLSEDPEPAKAAGKRTRNPAKKPAKAPTKHTTRQKFSGSVLRGDGLRAPLTDTAVLSGMQMVTFMVEEVPKLEQLSGVRVSVDPAIPQFRESDGPAEVAVSLLEREGSPDWFDLTAQVTVDGEDVPFQLLFVALARDEPFIVLPSGRFCSIQGTQFQRLRALIDEARKLGEVHGDTISINRFHTGLWSDFEALGIVDQQAASWKKTVTGLSDHTTITKQKVSKDFLAELRPYQQEGYDWLTFLYENGLGGVLADDMGLGKTIQTLAFVTGQREKLGRSKKSDSGSPFLVVAPTSVVANWALEAARFAPKLRVKVLDATLAKLGTDVSQIAADADLVLTSYGVFRLDAERYNTVSWAGLFLDEAQFVKNHTSNTYKAVRLFEAPFKLAITGTPMENNLMELWSMFSITAPGLLGNPQYFAEHYQRPIEKEANQDRLEQLKRRFAPLMLRRSKDLVVTELPPKQEQVLTLDLNPAHRAIYDTYLQRERQKVLGLMDDFDGNRFEIFRSLTLLRRAALDVGLIDEAHAGVASTKADALIEMLHEIAAEGHRTIVFSQFTSYLAGIRERLESEGIAYEYLDGSTTKRDRVIASFREGTAPVFLISLKSGGFGLNLTEADYCVLLDPWWNPAAEAQAIDRTHRIGQTRTVMVYRYVAKNTIEEKVMALKAGKEALFDSVIGDGGGSVAGLSAEDIRGLLE